MNNAHSSWNPIKHLVFTQRMANFSHYLDDIYYSPNKKDIFKVFEQPLSSIKVVILGQDPYYTKNVATGRAFGVSKGSRLQPSLKVIQEEIVKEGLRTNFDEDWQTLEGWEKQGVLLLNSALTVEVNRAGSHSEIWKEFTEKTVQFIAKQQPCIWLLWGKIANSYSRFITESINVNKYNISLDGMPITPYHNYILSAPHPASELYSSKSTGYLGCNHFKKTNNLLVKLNKQKINW